MIARASLYGVVAAEGLAVYCVAAWFAALYDRPDQHAISAFTLIAIAWVAFSLHAFLDGFELSERTRGLAAAGITALVLLLALRIEFAGDIAVWNLGWLVDLVTEPGPVLEAGADAIVGGIFAFALWVRALARAQADVDLEMLPASVVPSFALATFAVLGAAASDAAGEVARGAAAYYAVAVVAMTCSQLARSGATIGTVRSGGVVTVLLAGIGALATVSLLFAALLWGPLHGPVGSVLATTIENVLIVILTPPAWLLEQLFSLLFSGIDPGFEPETFAAEAAGQEPDPEAGEGDGVPQAFVFGSRILVLIVIIVVVAAVVAFLTRLRRKGRTEGDGPEREAAGSPFEDVRGFFGRFRRPQRRRAPGAADPATRLYLAVLHEAAAEGHARPEAATPNEFSPELRALFHDPVTDDITAAFDRARYGGYPPESLDIDTLERRWQGRGHA